MLQEMDGLSSREMIFVYAYVANGGIVGEAKREAGYRRGGRSPLVKPAVRAAIRDVTKKQLRKLGVDARDTIAELGAIAFAPLGDEAVPILAKIKALELLGKHQALFTEKIESVVRTRWEVPVNLESLTDEELSELVRLRRKVQMEAVPVVAEISNGS
jgi:hypothetical protein